MEGYFEQYDEDIAVQYQSYGQEGVVFELSVLAPHNDEDSPVLLTLDDQIDAESVGIYLPYAVWKHICELSLERMKEWEERQSSV